MAGASKFGGTENGADCSKCGGTVAVLFKTRNGTSLDCTVHTVIARYCTYPVYNEYPSAPLYFELALYLPPILYFRVVYLFGESSSSFLE